ncbi:hypothetical protein TPAU25S_00542 [Tsukamurella paurometabola]|uniref:DUF6542 domain-containing protein n=1 Tax=Tsukamurella paurometabola (strain ATCC 8368 / DSM 20162 / CCUG 35730 / CIP 100753 / JCM 10117 / KCTC 9821 / NBRC 16120 / NCIMB 702349 / NCTC 13040) TaxID=521096 RepID=D5UUY2_TSUPD|nr:hypothetical protein Tpau_3112 [Tsukamurella paurometabola DSM 20162]SUP36838.1 Uncharacterised protein [Tsukamurella paurometabola]
MLATVPGLPWWGAILTLLAFTAIGPLVSDRFAGSNAGVLAIAVGAVLAVLAVRNRSLFTAMVQPPLVMATAIPAYRWYAMPEPRSTSKILTEVMFPLVSLFPWMFWITVVVLAVGAARLVLYRRLTAAARSAQRGASTGAARSTTKTNAKTKATAKDAAGDRKPESAGLPWGDRLRAAFNRLRPTAATGAASAALAGTAATGGRAERHQSRAAASAPHRSSRRAAALADEAAPPRRGSARREETAPSTQQNRVVRPDSAPPRRPVAPRPGPDDRRADSGRVPRPRPRPITDGPLAASRDPLRDRDPREIREAQRRAQRDQPRPPRFRDADRDAIAARDPQSGPRRAVPRPESRDYRREARNLDRAREVPPPPTSRPERDRPRLPRDDYASLPRVSGGTAAQPDLPSLSRDTERAPRRAADTPSLPGKYEHYRAPRYRPLSDEKPAETDFRADFEDDAKSEPAPRPIRRHRYKD